MIISSRKDEAITTAIDAPSGREQRLLGAYYTPTPTAEYMADWLLRTPADTILEPSFGDGSFLRAVEATAETKRLNDISVIGVEIDPMTLNATVEAGHIPHTRAFCADFMSLPAQPVDAVIGNPPFVRLRNLGSEARSQALGVVKAGLGRSMDPSGSLWMPFVVHAANFLRIGGRMALVLPHELTYVKYARQIWPFLLSNFADVQVMRVRERLFPDILQDVVLLFCDGKGGSTDVIKYSVFETQRDLISHQPCRRVELTGERVASGERDFVTSLLSSDLRDLLEARLHPVTRPTHEVLKFNIGYVAGDKSYFHPSSDTARAFALPEPSLLPTLTSSRRLRGVGLDTVAVSDADALFAPPKDRELLTRGELAYIRHGEDIGVNKRYKCRIRSPWYVVPGLRAPDVVASVFSSTPLLMLNGGAFHASNSLLCGYLRPGIDARAFATSWYTSLTLLGLEMQVHSLGGGVLIMIPGEADNIRLAWTPTPVPLTGVDSMLRDGDIEGAYRAGDDQVLRQVHALTANEIDLVQEGVATLRGWRENRN